MLKSLLLRLLRQKQKQGTPKKELKQLQEHFNEAQAAYVATGRAGMRSGVARHFDF